MSRRRVHTAECYAVRCSDQLCMLCYNVLAAADNFQELIGNALGHKRRVVLRTEVSLICDDPNDGEAYSRLRRDKTRAHVSWIEKEEGSDDESAVTRAPITTVRTESLINGENDLDDTARTQ